MTQSETAQLARNEEKLDALSYAVNEIKEMLRTKDGKCDSHSDSIITNTKDIANLKETIAEMKSNQTWLWCTILGAVIVTVIGAVIAVKL